MILKPQPKTVRFIADFARRLRTHVKRELDPLPSISQLNDAEAKKKDDATE